LIFEGVKPGRKRTKRKPFASEKSPQPEASQPAGMLLRVALVATLANPPDADRFSVFILFLSAASRRCRELPHRFLTHFYLSLYFHPPHRPFSTLVA